MIRQEKEVGGFSVTWLGSACRDRTKRRKDTEEEEAAMRGKGPHGGLSTPLISGTQPSSPVWGWCDGAGLHMCVQSSERAAGCGRGLGMESTGHPRFRGLEIAGGLEELCVFHSLGGFLGGLPDTTQLWLTVPPGSPR